MEHKLVLVIDDDRGFHQSITYMTGNAFPVRFLSATKLHQARELFHRHRDHIDAIFVDGCVESRNDDCDTLTLIQLFKTQGFRGPIVAMASARHHRIEMCNAGATTACEKHELRHVIDERLLSLPKAKTRIARR